MIKNSLIKVCGFLLALMCFGINAEAKTVVNVTTAGTLSSKLSSTADDVKITGELNGKDIKYLRTMIIEHNLTTLDLADAYIVNSNDVYYVEDFNGSMYNNSTSADELGDCMFFDCENLTSIILPNSITSIGERAFHNTGITSIVIPDNVKSVQYEVFSDCPNLKTIVIGKKVTSLGYDLVQNSPVTDVYAKPVKAPTIQSTTWESNPTVHIFEDSYGSYSTKKNWEGLTLVKDLANYYIEEKEPKDLMPKYFKDYACTELKDEYQAMTDEALTENLTNAGMPANMFPIILKIKNNKWDSYEKDFRIHSYKAYSDAGYWNTKTGNTGGSHMGNPTGIYTTNSDDIYVFVDQDIPEDATLYITSCVENDLIYSSTTGTKLSKGVNVVPGKKNGMYYILYTADTKTMTKKLSEWPDMKIHIEGGVVNGYYDLAKHNDNLYKALLNKATYPLFTVKGSHSIFNFRTTAYKAIWPTKIDKSIMWFDSITVWIKDLQGITEEVVDGKRDFPLYNLTGGDGWFPSYCNNPNFAIQGKEGDAGYANSSSYRTQYNSQSCVNNAFNYASQDFDDWCSPHEVGHNHQKTINLEGCTEVSNNLFSLVVRLFAGVTASSGLPVSTAMNDYANHMQFSQRNISSRMRMYYQLFLYYHMARKNTSFYPNLFKALREDPLVLWKSPNQGVLKFAEKVCEVAQEDLTDFFRAWGFFEPVDNVKISDYGTYYMTVTQEEIDATLAKLAKYPKKNTEILFIEDRVTPLKTTGFLTTPGRDRKESAAPGEYANIGQFTDYQGTPSRGEYQYIQSDTLFAAIGTGGVGFIVKDKNDKLIYGSNTYSFCVPTSLLDEGNSIYSIDADGMTHKLEKAGSGSKTVNVTTAGTLSSLLDNKVLHVTITGKINGTDIAYLRKLSNEYFLCSIDLSGASIVSGGDSYDGTNKTSTNTISTNMFANCGHLIQVILPESVTSIGGGAFTHTGIKRINIPNSVLSIGGDAFAYCDKLTTVIVGEGLHSFSQGAFWSSDNVKDIYIYTATVPGHGAYFAGNTPRLHVYSELVDQYEKAGYGEYCEIVGDLYHEFFADEIAFENDEVIIKKGETSTLNLIVYPEGATCDLVWENLSPEIIDVVDGKVTGIAEGDAILIVTDQNNPFLMAMCFISVVNPVTAISFENEKETMKVGNTITLTPKVFPEDATAPDFVWESSKTDVATVEDGVVTAVAEGYAIIKVTTDEETPLSATCVITVKPAVDPVYEGGYSLNVKPFTLKSDKNDIDINLKNVKEVAKVDFDIYLPKNIITNDAYSVTLGTATSDNNKYQATISKNADGTLHMSCACKETNVIPENAGSVLKLGLKYINNDQPILADGLYGLMIDNIVATDANSVEHFVAPYYSYFKVGTNAKGEYSLAGNIPSVDLTDMVTSVSTTLNLENPNAVVITKTAINNTDNVIVNSVCDNLILTDEATFVPECDFTATSVTFSKSISNEWHTLVLPYNCEIPEGVKAYTFYNATSTTIEFVKIDGSVIPANTPVLLKSEEGIVDASFNASNCEVSTLLGETNFKGTYSTIPAGEATGKYILNNTGTAFGKATDKAWIPTFRCFYDPITSSSVDIIDQPSDDDARSNDLTIVIKDLTGIINHSLSKNEDVYNWHGFKGESKGVNAKGKKKYIK